MLTVREGAYPQDGFKRQRVVEQRDRRDRHGIVQVRQDVLGQLGDVVRAQVQKFQWQQAVTPAGPGLQVHVGQCE